MLFSDEKRSGQWTGRRTIEFAVAHLVFVFRTGESQLKRANNEHQIPSSPVSSV